MVIVRKGFSVVTEAFTTVNDHWPTVILSAVKRSAKHILTKQIQKKSDNNIFWENIQFLFSENGKIRDKTALVDENKNIISEEHLGSEELNNFFKNATKGLQINENPYIIDEKS